jgi:hypothetical protein
MVAVRRVVVDVKKKFAALGDGEQVAVQLDPPNRLRRLAGRRVPHRQSFRPLPHLCHCDESDRASLRGRV